MSRYYQSAKDPVDNIPDVYWHFYTPGYTVAAADNVVEFPTITLGSDYINYPLTSPTRVLVFLPGVPDYAGATAGTRPFQVKVNSTTFSRVSPSAPLTANTYKIFPSTSDNCALLELHAASVSVSDTVDYDGYFLNTVAHYNELNQIATNTTNIATNTTNIATKLTANGGSGTNNTLTNMKRLFNSTNSVYQAITSGGVQNFSITPPSAVISAGLHTYYIHIVPSNTATPVPTALNFTVTSIKYESSGVGTDPYIYVTINNNGYSTGMYVLFIPIYIP